LVVVVVVVRNVSKRDYKTYGPRYFAFFLIFVGETLYNDDDKRKFCLIIFRGLINLLAEATTKTTTTTTNDNDKS
jgi:hypothetical protein